MTISRSQCCYFCHFFSPMYPGLLLNMPIHWWQSTFLRSTLCKIMRSSRLMTPCIKTLQYKFLQNKSLFIREAQNPLHVEISPLERTLLRLWAKVNSSAFSSCTALAPWFYWALTLSSLRPQDAFWKCTKVATSSRSHWWGWQLLQLCTPYTSWPWTKSQGGTAEGPSAMGRIRTVAACRECSISISRFSYAWYQAGFCSCATLSLFQVAYKLALVGE